MADAYFQEEGVTLYNSDFLALDDVPYASVDLVVTSPPYNVELEYGVYNDELPYDQYLEFTAKWLAKCYSLLKSDGRMCLNVPLTINKNALGFVVCGYMGYSTNSRMEISFDSSVA